jgi:predicted nuclease of predicted toxin-antitoxin system
MKLVLDAQLPKRLLRSLTSAGCDVVHTSDLPVGNRTPDDGVIDFADRESRVVVTKDADFVDSFLLTGRPQKLLLVSTGNITNNDLELLILPLVPTLDTEFQKHNFLELDRSGMTVRG